MINQNVLIMEQESYLIGIIVKNENNYQVQLQNGQMITVQNFIDNTLSNTNIHQIINQLLHNCSININNQILLCLKNQPIQFQLKCDESYCFKAQNIILVKQLIDQQNFKQPQLLSSLIILNQLFKFNSNENSSITIFNNSVKYKQFNISNRIFTKNFKFPILNLFYNQNQQIDSILQQTQIECDFLSNNSEYQYDLEQLFNNIQRQDTYPLFKKLMISILLLTQIKSDIIQQQCDIVQIIEEQLLLGKQQLFVELTVKKRKMGNKFIEQPMTSQEIQSIIEITLTFLYLLTKQIIFNFDYNEIISQQVIKFETFSFPNTELNNLDALIDNYQFEKIHYLFYSKIKEEREQILKDNKIIFTEIPIINNKQILELFDKQPSGLFGLIQEHTISNTDEAKLFDKIKQLQRSYNKILKLNPQNAQIFMVTHSFAAITYTVSEFKQVNKYESMKQISDLLLTSSNPIIQKYSQSLNVQYKTNLEFFLSFASPDPPQTNNIILYEIVNDSYQKIKQQLDTFNITQYLSYYYQNYPYHFEVQNFVQQINKIFYLPKESSLDNLQYHIKNTYQIDKLLVSDNLVFFTLDQYVKIEIINKKFLNLFLKFKIIFKRNFRSFLLRKRLRKKLYGIKIAIEIQKLKNIISKTVNVLKWKNIEEKVSYLQMKSKGKLLKNKLKRRVLAKQTLDFILDNTWKQIINRLILRIQKIFRGNKVRKNNQQIIQSIAQKMLEYRRNKKATIIQKFFKSFCCQKRYRKKRQLIILIQSYLKMLLVKKSYIKTRIKLIYIQQTLRPIIKKKMAQFQIFKNFQNQQSSAFENFLKQNDKNLLNYEKLIAEKFDDQKIRIFQAILNCEFYFELKDIYPNWIQNYSLIWSKCFEKNKPIQILQVTETQTFLVDVTGKMYSWGMNEIKLDQRVKQFTAAENDIFIQPEQQWLKFSLNDQISKNTVSKILNFDQIYSKQNNCVCKTDNQITILNQSMQFIFKKSIDLVACGYSFTLILTKGQIWSLGENNFGQLGLGDLKNRSNPFLINLEMALWIECGQSHTIVKCMKNYYGFGNNRNGQLGLTNKQYTKPCQLILPRDEDILSFACAYKSTFLISGTQKIYASGECQNFSSKNFIVYQDYQFFKKQNFIPLKVDTSWSKTMSIVSCRFAYENLQEINAVKKNKLVSQLIQQFSHTLTSVIAPPKCEFVQKYCCQIYTNLAQQNKPNQIKIIQQSPKKEFSNLDQVKIQLLELQKKPKNKWSKEDFQFLESVNNLNILDQII